MAPGPGPVPLPGESPGTVVVSPPAPSRDSEADVGYMMTPRSSMSITHTKGLLNMPGQNNCFLNSAVQVLWHLDIFRRSFRELNGHTCMAESCIFCALKELFTQFQYSQESALPPDALRHALAKTFCDQRRFQLGFMDDAAECFENILLRIHFHIANKDSEDMCSAIHCIPHQKFAMTLVEQTVCHACGASSEPLPFTQMVHYVSTSALCSQAALIKEQNKGLPSQYFGELLQKAGGMGDIRDCPSACGAKIHIRKSLMNRPEIVSIGLVWDSECPTLGHIMEVFQNIGLSLRLQDVFHSVVDKCWASSATHQLVGVVTYYGKHYSTFFFHTKLRVWIYFDDAAVREIGPCWEQVVEKCCRGHFQPLLLLYANPYGIPVTTSTAPHSVTLVSEQKRSSGDCHLEAILQDEMHLMNHSHDQRHILGATNENFQEPMLSPQNRNTQCKTDMLHNMQDLHLCQDFYPYPEQQQQHHHHHHPHLSSCDSKPCCLHRPNYMPHPNFTCNSNRTHHYTCDNCAIPYVPCSHGSACCEDFSTQPLQECDNKHSMPCSLSCSPHIPSTNQVQPSLSSSASHYLPSVPMSEDTIPNLNQAAYQMNFGTGYPQDHILPAKSDLVQECAIVQPNITNTRDTIFDDGDQEPQNTYISRKAVENVLNLQKLQRQRSLNSSYSQIAVGNRNSSSSLESFDNTAHTKNQAGNHNLKLDIPDAENIPRRRDSGNWSGDRNSASSSSSTSLDNPYLMVVGNKRLLPGLSFRSAHSSGEGNNINISDQGYDSFSLSSTDSYPSVSGSPVKLDPRLTQIPENLQAVPDDAEDLQKKINLVIEKSTGPPDCDKLCAEADLLLSKSHEKEKEGDLVMAALLSDSAAAKARAAMDAPYNNSRSLVSAKMKHSTCVMRSSCLYRRLKEVEGEERRRQKSLIEGHHSRQSSRDSTHGRHSRQNSKDGTHSRQNSKDGSQVSPEVCENAQKSVEIYGTLLKKGSRRRASSGSGSTKSKDDNQVYKDFLDRQRKSTKAATGNTENSQKGLLNVKSQVKVDVNTSKSKLAEQPTDKHQKTTDVSARVGLNKSEKQDYELKNHSSEWENSKKSVLCRTYSGSAPLKSTESGKGGDSPLSDGIDQSSSCNPSKKQHKIKRKLMGGFMKRKNRSLPDLREGQDLTDQLDRAFDDTILHQVPNSPTLPSSSMKKKEDCSSEMQLNQVSRGFHQPHHAFINRDSYQRPLLMKVTPPHIQNSVISNNKGKHSVPSTIDCDSTDGIKQSSVRPTPFHSTLIPSPPLPPPPLETLIASPKQGLNLDSPASANHGSSKEMQQSSQSHIQNSTVDSGNELPPATSGFLAELQAKRQQIMEVSTLKNKDTELKPSVKPKGAEVQQLPLCAKGGETWLKELQSKQLQLLQKRNLPQHQNDLATDCKQDNQKSEEKSTVKEKPRQLCIPSSLKQATIRDSSQNHLDNSAVNVKGNFSSLHPSSVGTEQKASTSSGESEGKSVRSVKDLASRFEKILSGKPDETNSEASGTSSTKVGVCSEVPLSPKDRIHGLLRKSVNNEALETHHVIISDGHEQISKFSTAENGQENKGQILSTSEQNMQLHNFTESANINNQKNSNSKVPILEETGSDENHGNDEVLQSKKLYPVETPTGVTQKRRPEKPPDYETAIQRLGLIRERTTPVVPNEGTCKVGTVPGLQTAVGFSSSSSSTSVLVEPSKKKRGSKKSVTFSDEVVLVACADEDDSDYLPNPLLEKVYRQHLLHNGACETAPLNSPSETALKDINSSNLSYNLDNCCNQTHVQQEIQRSIGNTRDVPCHLCHKKFVAPSTVYCTDCAFYMSRFKPRE